MFSVSSSPFSQCKYPLLLCFLSFNLLFFSSFPSPGCFTPCFPWSLSSVPLPQWRPVLHYLLSCPSSPLLPPPSVLLTSSVFDPFLIFPPPTFLPPLLPVNPAETPRSSLVSIPPPSSPPHAVFYVPGKHISSHNSSERIKVIHLYPSKHEAELGPVAFRTRDGMCCDSTRSLGCLCFAPIPPLAAIVEWNLSPLYECHLPTVHSHQRSLRNCSLASLGASEC